MYQSTKWKYIWEGEFTNKFFALFSGVGNWVLNLFDANHYQIIDEERYRSEDQFYSKSEKKEEKAEDSSDTSQPTAQNINDLNSQNNLDNNQQNVINNQSIWIDLSGHEINNPENQINN